jgi:hypothetical protein
MRRVLTAGVGFFLAVAPLLAASSKECLDLAATRDHDISSPSGIRVTVTGRNHCQEDIEGAHGHFKIKALGTGNAVVGSQRGRFGGTVAPGSRVETKVFVVCDPDRVQSVSVEAQ